jgi:cell division protease FtsH
VTRPPTRRRRIAIYTGLIAVMLGVNYWGAHRATEVRRVRIPYSPFFLHQVQRGNVSEIASRGTTIQGRFHHATAANASRPATLFITEIPAFANTNELARLLQSKNVEVNAQPLDSGLPLWKSLLYGFGPTILFLLLLFSLVRRAGPQGILGALGRSGARRYRHGGAGVTFADVAGIDDAKFELDEVADFLRNPEKYRQLGGRIPRGVLLSGPPGTGKTLLARAVAGEAGVPFFSMSASEFVQAIVGVGASRVRDLFKQARDAAPAIVFIDELDAIGRARGAGASFGGGSDEREQTLNQILTEMDGFDSSVDVIVVAATNRPDVLDKALLRSGRFDRRVVVQPPDSRGRRMILDVHTRSMPLADDVDFERLAAKTPGMVGAELATLVNEAALLAARRDRSLVTAVDFDDALERIVLGAERKIVLSEEDRRTVAYHEAGHALVGMLTPGADPVRIVSIIPRGSALGVTFSSPDADRLNYSSRHLDALIRVALGGRAAETVALGEITTGAEADIVQVTRLARHMVGRWGMNDKVGLLAVIGNGDAPAEGDEFAISTRELVDREVKRLVDEANSEVLALLRSERHRLDALALALLERETLDEIDAYAAAGLPRRERAAV